MAKVRMYGINNGKYLNEHTSNRREELRFRKKMAKKQVSKATGQKKGNGGESCV